MSERDEILPTMDQLYAALDTALSALNTEAAAYRKANEQYIEALDAIKAIGWNRDSEQYPKFIESRTSWETATKSYEAVLAEYLDCQAVIHGHDLSSPAYREVRKFAANN